jgi:hypothetical protein
LPATYVHIAFYYENFLSYFPPRRTSDGTYVFGFPQGSTPLAAVAAEDVGGVVAAIFAESFWYRDKVIGVVGDDQRCDDYAEIMHRVLRRPFAYRYVAHDAFAALGFPGRERSGGHVRVQPAVRAEPATRPREVARAVPRRSARSSAGCAVTRRRSNAPWRADRDRAGRYATRAPCCELRAARATVVRRALHDQPSAFVAAFGPEIDDPVRFRDHIEIVLDHDHGVAGIDQPMQHAKSASRRRPCADRPSARRARKACPARCR